MTGLKFKTVQNLARDSALLRRDADRSYQHAIKVAGEMSDEKVLAELAKFNPFVDYPTHFTPAQWRESLVRYVTNHALDDEVTT